MHFRSLSDLVEITRTHAGTLPDDFDLIVGVPRSGMIPATIIALVQNLPLLNLPGFLRGELPESGMTRQLDNQDGHQPRKVLVVEDSLSSGRSLASVRERIAQARPDVEPTYLSVISAPENTHLTDLYFDECPHPRFFEWNLMNGQVCGQALFDLDGIFCRDPVANENDDGATYRHFLSTVPVLNRPRQMIRGIVTARLETYRADTETWLHGAGINYGTLNMLGGVTATERRERKMHAPFKAEIYAKDKDAKVFIESDLGQASEIARLSGKPVLHFATMTLIEPDALSLAKTRRRLEAAAEREHDWIFSIGSRLKSLLISRR